MERPHHIHALLACRTLSAEWNLRDYARLCDHHDGGDNDAGNDDGADDGNEQAEMMIMMMMMTTAAASFRGKFQP